MGLIESSVLLFAALIILSEAAKILLERALRIAGQLRISQLSVGFLLVSLATTLPELIVSLTAAAQGQTSLVLGNVFGSNVTNLALVLGIVTFWGTTRIHQTQARRMTRLLLVLTLIPATMLLVNLGAIAGILLVAAYAGFAWTVLREDVRLEKTEKTAADGVAFDVFVVLAAGAVLALSAKAAVDSAVDIAGTLSISQAFVGATLIAIGTSIPELAIAIQSVRSKSEGITIGNLLGASLTNLTLNLGLATLIHPPNAEIGVALGLVGFSLVVNHVLLFFLRKGASFGRREGAILLALYGAYVVGLAAIEWLA